MVGSVSSIVSCKDLENKNFQVQGALSNLDCKKEKKKNKTKIKKMKFSEWYEIREAKEKKVPKKYLKGLKEKGEYGSKQAMKKEIKKFSGSGDYKKNWNADYKNGERIKTKKSSATKAYEKMYEANLCEASDNINVALKNKSKKTGISKSILRKVYNRGKAAWNSGHRPGVAQDQWAMGRVNSFITGSGGARKADKDLWDKAKKSRKKK